MRIKHALIFLVFSTIFINFGMPLASAVECQTATQRNCTVTLRDNRGIKIGSEDRGSSGVTVVKNSRGIKQGTITSSTSKPSCEVVRDSRGIKIGTRGNC